MTPDGINFGYFPLCNEDVNLTGVRACPVLAIMPPR
jgi:hypothetical protein